jgi:hypothetical protein
LLNNSVTVKWYLVTRSTQIHLLVRKREVLRGEAITCKQGHELLAHFMHQNEKEREYVMHNF